MRTLERRIAAGDIRSAYRRVAHRRPMVVLHPEDLARLVAEEGAGTAVIMTGPQQIAPQYAPSITPESADIAPTSRQSVSANNAPTSRHESLPPEIVLRRAGRSRYVTLPEAREYIGLPVAYLRARIEDGKLPAVKAGKWYVRTADLDRL